VRVTLVVSGITDYGAKRNGARSDVDRRLLAKVRPIFNELPIDWANSSRNDDKARTLGYCDDVDFMSSDTVRLGAESMHPGITHARV